MTVEARFRLVDVLPPQEDDLARAVSEGLRARPRSLPCRFFYDEQGSRLFEEICLQPEYYPPRAEREVLAARADELARRFEGAAVVELGSGNSEKTELVLAAFCRRRPQVRYVPVDICPEIIEDAGERLVAAHPGLFVHGIAAEYEAGLAEVVRRVPGPKLVLSLGGNVGNFDRAGAAALLGRLRVHLGPHDGLLLGVDLRKDRATLERAYDDAAGVTARFNLNLLERLNRELDADFDLERFEHLAEYDEVDGVVRIFLVSRAHQTVRVGALRESFVFARGERVHTEDSTKYSRAELEELAAAAGFALAEHWTDGAGRFSSNLLLPA